MISNVYRSETELYYHDKQHYNEVRRKGVNTDVRDVRIPNETGSTPLTIKPTHRARGMNIPTVASASCRFPSGSAAWGSQFPSPVSKCILLQILKLTTVGDADPAVLPYFGVTCPENLFRVETCRTFVRIVLRIDRRMP